MANQTIFKIRRKTEVDGKVESEMDENIQRRGILIHDRDLVKFLKRVYKESQRAVRSLLRRA